MMSLTRSKFASRIAPAAESANKYVKASTVKLVGPNRLNLAKIMANQNTRMTKERRGTLISPCPATFSILPSTGRYCETMKEWNWSIWKPPAWKRSRL